MKKISAYLKQNKPYYAHLKDAHKETLEEHSDLVMSYFEKMTVNRKSHFSNDIKAYLKTLNIENEYVSYLAIELFKQAIYLHDLGKINPNFQIIKMKNSAFGSICSEDSHHSIYSALIYLHIFHEDIIHSRFNRKEQRILIRLWVTFAYAISRHHGYLNTLDLLEETLNSAMARVTRDPHLIGEYIDDQKLREDQNKLSNLINNGMRSVETDTSKAALLLWLLSKDLYAYIVTCDFYATGHYMTGHEIKTFGAIDSLNNFTHKFYDNPLIKAIKSNMSNLMGELPINILRTQMFHEAERNYLQNIQNDVFYLEAPTGCGKTLTSINLAVKIMETSDTIRRVFYVFPFNTLVEQTANVLKDLFDEKDIAIINSVESIKIDESEDYNKSYLDKIMLHYPVIVTSHVNFFSALVGVSRESHLMFSHLKNSVVIIDEIQSYKNMIWHELIEVIHLAAELYNIKFVIMSATLPKISELLDAGGTMLIEDTSIYYQNALFKNRTTPIFDFLDQPGFTVEHLCDAICKQIESGAERILVEFIDKVSARLFFDLLTAKNPDETYQIFELTGDDPSYYRQKLINQLKAKNSEGSFSFRKVVVIATQVIEAGVDIDMFIGYKDISILDSEEQFAGRINRSCLRTYAPIYFFNIFEQRMIYKNDVRSTFSLEREKERTWFREKNYQMYFSEVMKKLKIEKNRFNQNSVQLFYDAVEKLDYLQIQKHLRLIDQETVSIFIPQNIQTEEGEINGSNVWRDYITLMEDRMIPYTEKQIKLSQMSKVFSYFTYSVKHKPIEFMETIGDRMFLLGFEKFMRTGKFDRKYYNEVNGKGNFSPEDLIL